MPFLEQSEAVRLRTALVEDGFAIVPNVCPPALLKKIQVWSDELLDDPTHPEWGEAHAFDLASNSSACVWSGQYVLALQRYGSKATLNLCRRLELQRNKANLAQENNEGQAVSAPKIDRRLR
eukprot:SAG31_NODE_263_length_18841_cov_17.270996_5_plen_122_part_00